MTDLSAYLQPVSLETAQKLGLSESEFETIKQILGRSPNFTEVSVFSVMWSEHCSYKNSILLLKTLPREGKDVLAGAGEENAGLIAIDDDLAVCFKIESHNHPSAIEPYQGAATGVGGIHRDIFTMGARPIAALNSLRFGNLEDLKTKYLMNGVIRGIGDYGNAFGVPTVGGEMFFDACYATNPLVNAMSVGIVEKKQSIRAIAQGVGNPVFIVGSETGKDGIHGATFASQDITANSAQNLPSVQVGDPFMEKLLLEASLEAIATGGLVGMQDMGAAGIACSTSEMSAKGNVGMKLWLDRTPMRQESMLPFELLLSESQERMLLVVKKGFEQTIQAIFDKWDLPCVQIGEVTEDGFLRYYWYGQEVGCIPAQSLVLGGGAPVYKRDQKIPEYTTKVAAFREKHIPDIESLEDFEKVCKSLITHPNIASKRHLTQQYDSTVGAATLSNVKKTAAPVVLIHGTSKALAMTTDCNPRFVYLDPYQGAAHAVAEAARNLVCTGAKPLGITNCLNFGNPYNPEVYWQFAQAIAGMGDACRAFGLPVTGGNVSFYNQIDQNPVFPTPTVGMVGLINNVEQGLMTADFKDEGDMIMMLGKRCETIAASTYLYSYLNKIYSPVPPCSFEQELKLQQVVLGLIDSHLIKSADDVAEGGLFTAVFEGAISGGKGAVLNEFEHGRLDAFWFGESGGRVIVTISPEKFPVFAKRLLAEEFDFFFLGTVQANAYLEFSFGKIALEPLTQLYEATFNHIL